ncbi:MAG: S-adenosylmethionine decarboxylase [Vicinamibacterales bacterium]
MTGVEWIVEASGCSPVALADRSALDRLFAGIVEAARLTPVAGPLWHAFPATGGLSGLVVLAESHLTCHTFPEHGSLCLNVFCCRARPEWPLREILRLTVGAEHVRVRRLARPYGAHAVAGATVGDGTEVDAS